MSAPDPPFYCLACKRSLPGVREWVCHIITVHTAKAGVDFKCCNIQFNTFRPKWLKHLREQPQAAVSHHPATRGRRVKKLRTRKRTGDALSALYANSDQNGVERNSGEVNNGLDAPVLLAAAAAAAAKPSVNHWQSDPGYSALPADLRSLVSGVYMMPGATAYEAFFPFLSLLRILSPVRRIVGASDGAIDATAPLHWATKGYLPLSGTKLLELVMSEMNSGRGRSAKFQSGRLVDPVEGLSNAALNVWVLSHMIVPSPNSAELTYAANLDGQSKDFRVHVPGALFLHRHFDEEDIEGQVQLQHDAPGNRCGPA